MLDVTDRDLGDEAMDDGDEEFLLIATISPVLTESDRKFVLHRKVSNGRSERLQPERFVLTNSCTSCNAICIREVLRTGSSFEDRIRIALHYFG